MLECWNEAHPFLPLRRFVSKVPKLALECFAATAVEVAEEAVTQLVAIFDHPRNLKGFLGHFVAWIPEH